VVTPETGALPRAVPDARGARAAEAARLRPLQGERAQEAADLAPRRARRGGPASRLVADVREAAWQATRRALAAARHAAAPHHHPDQAGLRATARETMLALPHALPRFRPAPRTTARARTRVARRRSAEVTVEKGDHMLAQSRFKGGATRVRTGPVPPPVTPSRFTPAATGAASDPWVDTWTDAAVAVHLQARGYRPCIGFPVQATPVSQRRRAPGLKARLTRRQEAGMRTAAAVAAPLGVSAQTVWRWDRRGWRMGTREKERRTWVFVPPATAPPRSRRRRVGALNRP
jgi:hypothetical protein